MSDNKRGFFGRLFGGKEEPSKAQPEDLEIDAENALPEETADTEASSEEPSAADTSVEDVASADEAVVEEPQAEETKIAEVAVEPVVEPEAESEAVLAEDAHSEVEADDVVPDVPAVSEPVAVVAAEPVEAPAETEAPEVKKSWFQRLTSGLSRSSSALTDGISSIFTKRKLDAAMLEELEDILLQADLGVDTAMSITDRLSDGRFDKEISPEEVRSILSEEVQQVLEPVAQPLNLDKGKSPHVVLMVGVNGTGKTTTIGKLSQKLAAEGKTVMLAAGDTFRAAAVEQLKIWGKRTGAEVVARDTGADAAGLAYDAMEQAKAKNVDVLLIDTAGRLQNKTELMDELEKVIRVIKKHDPDAPHDVILTLDATTGQNALNQVEIFGKVAGVTGLVMTKLDGTARGGILVAIAAKHKLPVHFIGVGEGVEDLEPFSAKDFATAIAGLA